MRGRLLAVGLSHHTAPIDLRERLAFGDGSIPGALARLRSARLGHEAVLLSTCNRVELYTLAPRPVEPDQVADWLLEEAGLAPRGAGKHLYRLHSREAVRHLFRVASSLDSMVLGEPQIVAQVKAAYRLAVEHDAAGPVLGRIMDRALGAAKRVRSETDIARETVSVGRAGVELARQVVGSLEGRSALLIGAGAHGKLVARALLDQGLGELVVANRTFSAASRLAARFGGSAVHLDSIAPYLERVDVVLTSTAAGRLLVHRRELATIARKRRHRSLVMIDLSVPRNIDPDVNELGGVYRFDVDDLDQLAESGRQARRVAADAAERIVGEEVERCWRMLQAEGSRASLGTIVRHAEQLRQAELARAMRSLGDLDMQQQAAVEAMTRALVKKVLHRPLSQARALAEEGETMKLDVLLAALRPDGKASPSGGEDD